MSNLDLEINTFQFKTINSANEWNTRKGYKPLKSEPIFITADAINGIDTSIFLIGDGTSTLEALVNNNKYFVYKEVISQPGVQSNITRVKSDGSQNSAGISDAYARADHQHTLDRKISSGTDDPTGGAIGDIYIKIEGNA